MGLEQKHPLYTENVDLWKKNRDVYQGPERIKQQRETYLPPTQGMVIDGMKDKQPGAVAYEAYLGRAVFPEIYREGVDMLVGVMHKKPCDIKLPQKLEFMRDKATIQGESLELLLRRINTEQLTPGRLGLLLDFQVQNNIPKPYISLYYAEAITNWDDSNDYDGQNELQLVILDESGYKREGFEWKNVTQYRVLQLGLSPDENSPNDGPQTVHYGCFKSTSGIPDYEQTLMEEYLVLGQSVLQIPFVFVNSRDMLATPDVPPMNGLANICISIYKGEADYRQTMFLQSQETLVIIGSVRNPDGIEGEDDAIRTGTGSRIDIDQGGDAKYVGVSGAGLTEQRLSLENDYKRAERKAGQMLSDSSKAESGEALQIRVSAQTANLVQIALTGARALETLLKQCAELLGADPKEVKVDPNLEFSTAQFNAQDLTQYMTARTMGVPLSLESIHALLVDKGITKLDFRTEKKLYDKEMQSSDITLPGTGFGDQNGNGDGEE